MVMKIPLQQVIEAIEMVDDAFTALWDSKTGETVYLDDGLISGMRNEELENLLETEASDSTVFHQSGISMNTASWKILSTA